MPKRNYGFEKRQKELKRQDKREQKRLKKLERAGETPPGGEVGEPPDTLPKR